MGMLTKIDLTLRRIIYSIFWFFYSPLNMTRLFSQLQNRVNREIMISSDGHDLIAPDRFEILVNPVIYRNKRNEIHAIQSKLEYDIRHYIENQGYLIRNSSIDVSIFSMSRIRKNGIEIRCRVSKDEELDTLLREQNYLLSIVGNFDDNGWILRPGKTYKIGRIGQKGDIVLPFPNISKNHAVIEVMPQGKLYIRDLGSTNGTYVNDEKIQADEDRFIKIRDRIQLCKEKPVFLELSKPLKKTNSTILAA